MDKPAENPSLGAILFFFVLFAVSLGTEYQTIGIFLEAQASASWPTANGRIQHSAVETELGLKTKYSVSIQYTYEVQDKNYVSNSIRARGVAPRYASDAEKVAKQFPQDSDVTVYYNPKDHSQSYLEVGLDYVNYIIVISPLIFAAFGGIGFIGGTLDFLRPAKGTIVE
jgi:hypothetical protein